MSEPVKTSSIDERERERERESQSQRETWLIAFWVMSKTFFVG